MKGGDFINTFAANFGSELLGTALLLLLGNGVGANVTLKNTKGNNGGWLLVTMGWGLAVAMSASISSALGGQAHFNPAVTIAFAIGGNWETTVGPNYLIGVYLCAQIIGAFIGQLLVDLLFFQHIVTHVSSTEYSEEKRKLDLLMLHSTVPAMKNYFLNSLAEFFGTAVLVLGLMIVVKEGWFVNYKFIIPLFAGTLITTIGICLGGLTGFAINPIRDLAPRIIHQILPMKNKGSSQWEYAWVPVIMPLLAGAVCGASMLAI